MRIRIATACVAPIITGTLIALLALPVASYATEYEEPPQTFEPLLQAENFSIIEQRQTIYDTPEYQAELAEQGLSNSLEATEEQAEDPARLFSDDLCFAGENGCAGDVRLYNWEKDGSGLVRKVLFTSRGGATISARVWETAGRGRRPGVVITPGSVQADEQMYWYAAQALAKDGYIVMTFDAQGQGQSDTFGQAPDEDEGFPAQTDGRPSMTAPRTRSTSSCPRPNTRMSPCRAAKPGPVTPPSRTNASSRVSTRPTTPSGVN